MKIRAYAKQVGILALALGVVAGCAQQTTTEEPQACEVSAEVQNAIDAAKAALREAEAAGCAWSETQALIEQAEAAAQDCDNEQAIKLANQAKRQAENALRQCQTEEPPEPEPMVEPEPTMGSYTVENGDSLWAISGLDYVYADPYQWPLIYKANASIIQDADLIYPGQVLEFTKSPYSTDVEAAIQHAKTRGAWSIGVVEESDKAYLAQ